MQKIIVVQYRCCFNWPKTPSNYDLHADYADPSEHHVDSSASNVLVKNFLIRSILTTVDSVEMFSLKRFSLSKGSVDALVQGSRTFPCFFLINSPCFLIIIDTDKLNFNVTSIEKYSFLNFFCSSSNYALIEVTIDRYLYRLYFNKYLSVLGLNKKLLGDPKVVTHDVSDSSTGKALCAKTRDPSSIPGPILISQLNWI